jgi:hypothetical protein
MRTFNKTEYEWGIKKELECLPFISEVLDDVIHNKETYNDFDYYTDTYNIELKSRRNKKDTYSTTITTKIKRDKAIKSKKKVLWIFNFTDGLYYLNYEDHKDTLNNLPVEKFFTRNGIRYNIEIPVSILSPLVDFKS